MISKVQQWAWHNWYAFHIYISVVLFTSKTHWVTFEKNKFLMFWFSIWLGFFYLALFFIFFPSFKRVYVDMRVCKYPCIRNIYFVLVIYIFKIDNQKTRKYQIWDLSLPKWVGSLLSRVTEVVDANLMGENFSAVKDYVSLIT